MLEILYKLLVYSVSVWASSKYADGYLAVGAIFGMAVISWDCKSFRNILSIRYFLFFIASISIWALVYFVAMQSWTDADIADMLIGSLPVAVLLGSAFLPLAHKFIFGGTFRTAILQALRLVASFYLISIVSYINDQFDPSLEVNFLMISIAAWQGIYLYYFYHTENKRFLKKA